MMQQRYTLDKMSSPGWTFQTDHLHHILRMLDHEVCNSCKMTKSAYEARPVDPNKDYDIDIEGVNPYTFTEFFPENYSDLTDEEKIHLLLSTACGCEYDFEDNENPRNPTTNKDM